MRAVIAGVMFGGGRAICRVEFERSEREEKKRRVEQQSASCSSTSHCSAPSMPPKLTNPLRPVARYRKGQAPLGAASDSDSDAEQQHQDDDDDASPSTGTAIKNESDDDDVEKKPKLSKKAGSGKMAVQLNQVQVDDKGGVLVGGRGESGRTLKEQQDEQGSSSEYGTFELLCLV